LGQKASAIFAHYKPLNQNFRLAAPNKVYEAFALARPLLINSEAVISQMCRDEGFGYVSPYAMSRRWSRRSRACWKSGSTNRSALGSIPASAGKAKRRS
jgi:hypothetical protein